MTIPSSAEVMELGDSGSETSTRLSEVTGLVTGSIN